MTVDEIMSKDGVFVKEDDFVTHARQMMRDHFLRGLPVIDDSEKVVGILVARKDQLTQAHLEAVGIQPGSNYVITGAEDDGCCPEFEHLWYEPKRTDPPGAYYDKAEQEFLQVAVDFYRAHPNMGAMMLECTGMQPFARALQREIDIPILSWGTLLDYAYSVVVHRDYYGHV